MKGEKTGGRAKGTPNKVTQEVRELFNELVRENLPQLRIDLATLEPYQRVNALVKLSQFILPKPTEATLEITGINPKDVWLSLSPEERISIFDNDSTGSN